MLKLDLSMHSASLTYEILQCCTDRQHHVRTNSASVPTNLIAVNALPTLLIHSSIRVLGSFHARRSFCLLIEGCGAVAPLLFRSSHFRGETLTKSPGRSKIEVDYIARQR